MQKKYDIATVFKDIEKKPENWIKAIREEPKIIEAKIVNVLLSFEKDKDANPYYSSNIRLKSCCDACLEIINHDWTVGTEKNSDSDFAYLLNNNIFVIERIAGGHRTPMKNNTEIEFTAILRPHTTVEAFSEVVLQICDKNGVNSTFKE